MVARAGTRSRAAKPVGPPLRSRGRRILARLAAANPDWGPTLSFTSPFELLVATILFVIATNAWGVTNTFTFSDLYTLTIPTGFRTSSLSFGFHTPVANDGTVVGIGFIVAGVFLVARS